MSDRRQIVVLRFSRVKAAFQSLISAMFIAICLYIAREDLGDGGLDGHWLEIAIGIAIVGFFVWTLGRAMWRLFASEAAATWDGSSLHVHRSCGSVPDVSVADIEKVELYQGVAPRYFGLLPGVDTLSFTLANVRGLLGPKRIRLWSDSIEGGRDALERLESAVKSGFGTK